MTTGDKIVLGAGWVVSLAISLAGLGVISYQCLLWLRDGYWTKIPLSVLVIRSAPPIDWSGARGVEKIVDSIGEESLGWTLLILGVFCLSGMVRATQD
jgi:hypothetical protein